MSFIVQVIIPNSYIASDGFFGPFAHEGTANDWCRAFTEASMARFVRAGGEADEAPYGNVRRLVRRPPTIAAQDYVLDAVASEG